MIQQSPWRDRTLTCESCGVRFLDSAAEQRARDAVGQSKPGQCPGCMALAQLDRQRYGIITWYNPRRGYGFIRDDNGRKVFVHASALVVSHRAPRRGQAVSYHLMETERGPSATQVRLAPPPEQR